MFRTRRFHAKGVAGGGIGDGMKIEYRDVNRRLLMHKEAFARRP